MNLTASTRWMVPALALMTLGQQAEVKAQNWVAFETIEQSALPIVRASLNGSGGHRLVLDVGINPLILDTTLVDGIGLQLASTGGFETIDLYGKPEQVPVALLQELKIGNASFEMVKALLVEGEDGTGSGGLRSYGRVGRDVLEPLRLTISYPRKLLLLEASPKGDVPPGGVFYETAGRFLLIPVRLERDGVQLEVPFVLDAGTSTSLVDRKWAEKNHLAEKKAAQAEVGELEVGGYRTGGVALLLGSMNELPYEGQPVGVLGADLLTRVSVTYDFARDLVWLVDVAAEGEKGPS
jgi:hypothetical protein